MVHAVLWTISDREYSTATQHVKQDTRLTQRTNQPEGLGKPLPHGELRSYKMTVPISTGRRDHPQT